MVASVVMRASSASAATRTVLVESDLEDTAALEGTLDELLSRIGLSVTHDPKMGNTWARVRIQRTATGAVIVVEDARSGRAAIRRDVPALSSPALFRETVAHVVLGAVEPLAAEPAEPSAPAPAPVIQESSTETRAGWHLVLGADGRAGMLSTTRPAGWIGGHIRLAKTQGLRPAVSLDAAYQLPVTIETADLRATATGALLRAKASIEPASGEVLSLETGLTAGADVLTLTPQSTGRPAHVQGSTRAQPLTGLFGAGRWHIVPTFDVVLVAGVEVDLAPRRWVIETSGTRQEFFSSARVRPFAGLGVEFRVFTTERGGTR